MRGSLCFRVSVVLLSLVPSVWCFSSGASRASCRAMVPSHIRAQPLDSGWSHVALTTSASSYLPGQLVTVTVRSSRDFMGFLLQARTVGGPLSRTGGGVTAGSTKPGPVLVGGSWTLTPPGTQTLRCLAEDDTLTHTDKHLKRNLSFVWKAPAAPMGDIRFYITVVQSYFVYWAGIESALVHDGSRSSWRSAITAVDRLSSLFVPQKGVTALPDPSIRKAVGPSVDPRGPTSLHYSMGPTRTAPVQTSSLRTQGDPSQSLPHPQDPSHRSFLQVLSSGPKRPPLSHKGTSASSSDLLPSEPPALQSSTPPSAQTKNWTEKNSKKRHRPPGPRSGPTAPPHHHHQPLTTSPRALLQTGFVQPETPGKAWSTSPGSGFQSHALTGPPQSQNPQWSRTPLPARPLEVTPSFSPTFYLAGGREDGSPQAETRTIYSSSSPDSSMVLPSTTPPHHGGSTLVSKQTSPPSLPSVLSSPPTSAPPRPSTPFMNSSDRPSPAPVFVLRPLTSSLTLYSSIGSSSSPPPPHVSSTQLVTVGQKPLVQDLPDPDPNLTPTPTDVLHPDVGPHPNLHPNFKHNLDYKVKPKPSSAGTKPRRPPSSSGTPDKEGKLPDIIPRRTSWELGVLLVCSAGLGMILVMGVRYIHRHTCGNQTAVTLNDREPEYRRGGLTHVQECGDLVRVRRIQENSLVLLAEYDILATPGDAPPQHR